MIDDQNRTPNMNNRDHLVGRPTSKEGEQCKKKCNFFARNFCLFHDGWLAKLKQDWRFCETEPQGGDEKALSNNSNSHQMTLKSSYS